MVKETKNTSIVGSWVGIFLKAHSSRHCRLPLLCVLPNLLPSGQGGLGLHVTHSVLRDAGECGLSQIYCNRSLPLPVVLGVDMRHHLAATV
jgi:hypothetical protein